MKTIPRNRKIKYLKKKKTLVHSLTNNMSCEKVLKLNIVVLLPPMFINKHSFKVVSEKVRVGGQVKLEVSEVKKEKMETRYLY